MTVGARSKLVAFTFHTGKPLCLINGKLIVSDDKPDALLGLEWLPAIPDVELDLFAVDARPDSEDAPHDVVHHQQMALADRLGLDATKNGLPPLRLLGRGATLAFKSRLESLDIRTRGTRWGGIKVLALG